jgi:PLP dependent protein
MCTLETGRERDRQRVMTAVESVPIAQRLNAVRDRVHAAGRRAGRAPDSVRLVLASKTQPPPVIRAAYDAGARDFGENYVQEAMAKQAALADLKDIRWHLIGHLQSNKARTAAASFDIIHSLDSPKLAGALARARPDQPMPVLVEINLGGEASKTGVAPEDAQPLIEACRGKVEVLGLMAIPPPGAGPEPSRSYFVRLRQLRDRLAAATGIALSELSMGMTEDFEVAIEEGATIVRVGRAIFGERPR